MVMQFRPFVQRAAASGEHSRSRRSRVAAAVIFSVVVPAARSAALGAVGRRDVGGFTEIDAGAAASYNRRSKLSAARMGSKYSSTETGVPNCSSRRCGSIARLGPSRPDTSPLTRASTHVARASAASRLAAEQEAGLPLCVREGVIEFAEIWSSRSAPSSSRYGAGPDVRRGGRQSRHDWQGRSAGRRMPRAESSISRAFSQPRRRC